MGLTDYSFTPSEYIFLNGEKFIPEATGRDSIPMLCSDSMVNGHQLAALLVLAAILANEAEGVLAIETREKKKLLGGGVKKELFLHAVKPSPNWSGYTLEAAIMFTAGNLFSTQSHTLYNIVYSILAKDQPDSWQKIIELVEWGLASSNFLLPVQGEAAEAFLTPFVCPGRVRELVEEQSVRPFLALINSCKQRRSELWQEMSNEIERVFHDRSVSK